MCGRMTLHEARTGEFSRSLQKKGERLLLQQVANSEDLLSVAHVDFRDDRAPKGPTRREEQIEAAPHHWFR